MKRRIRNRVLALALVLLTALGSMNHDVHAQSSFAPASENSTRGFVTRMYNVVQGRQPDVVGYNYWVEELNSGHMKAADIVEGFFSSDEYKAKSKSNAQIVTDYYNAMLNRAPDQVGFDFWKNRLDAGCTSQVLNQGFVSSTEFKEICSFYGIQPGTVTCTAYTDQNYERTYFVYRLYRNCLGRYPDSEGQEYWCKQIANGQSGSSVAAGFVFSDEYKAKNASDEQYIEMLYQTVHGRASDPQGKAYWLTYLKNGASREAVLNGFLFSDEFKKQCQTAGINVGEKIADPNEPKHTHTWDNGTVTKQATCIAEGELTYKCTGCGETKTAQISKSADHDWSGEYTITQNATCSQEGAKELHCKLCGVLLDTQTIGKTAHQYSWVTTQEATTEADGLKEFRCEACGDVSATEVIPKIATSTPDPTTDPTEPTHQHNYRVLSSKTATCTSAGYNEYICSSCGEKYKEDIPALGHDYYMSAETKANCSHPGWQWYTCTRCNDEYNIKSEPQLEHDWVCTETPATCTKNGELYKECSRCKSSSRTTIPKLGHNYQWVVVKQPTAEEDGLKEYTCSLCGDVNSRATIPKNASGCTHPYPRNFEVVTPATCCTYAVGKIICKECGEVLNASYEDVEEGYDTTNHTHFTEEVVKEATYKEAGTRKYTCDGCGYSYTEEIPKLVCNHSKTCIACKPNSDETWEKCEICGEYLKQVQMSSEPCTHSGCGRVEIERVPVSETQEGVYDYACEKCGHVFSTYTLHPYKTYSVTFADGHTQTVYGWFDSEYANCEYGQEVLALTNEYRKENGLNELHYNSTLQWASNQRALEASVNWTHDRPDGTKWNTVTTEWKYGGENLASGQSTPSEAMKDWKKSPDHNHALLYGKANGEKPFKGVSVGAFHKYLFNNTSQPHKPTEYVAWAQNFTFKEY